MAGPPRLRLAVALDTATRGLSAPPIPSDRPLSPGSLVHYHYGGVGDRFLQTPLGEILPAMVTPDYMVGYAGVAVYLLRLSDPARRPHQLSREGFRFRRPPIALITRE